ncbi:MAG: LysR family transcriptional regulator [Lachnospiraceae bacterium]|nr:LysR family transcriptional regulator [Lachnospiraceae bacterium]
MPEIMQYKAFVEAAKTGSLTAAANVMSYSQPGVSRLIHLLEKECGFPLLYRSKQGVTLSENGRQIYTLCQDILNSQNSLLSTIQQISGVVTGTLRIGSYLSVLSNWMPLILRKLSEEYPQLEILLTEGNRESQLDLLENNDIDIGILSSSAPGSYSFIPLYMDPAVVVLPREHELCAKEKISNSDIISSTVLAQPDNHSEVLKNVLGEQYPQAKRRYLVKSDYTVIRLVESGLGIGVVGRMVVRSSDEVEIRPLEQAYYRRIGMAVPKWKPISPALKVFIRTVCDLYQQDGL